MHVVDAGYSADWLRTKVKTHVAGRSSALDIVDDLLGLLQANPKQYIGYVVVKSAPKQQLLAQSDQWVDPADLRVILEPWGGIPSGLNHVGGLRFESTALDPLSAAREAELTLERIAARTRFAINGATFEFEPKLFTKEGAYPLVSRRNGIRVSSLAQSTHLFSANMTDQAIAIDDAFLLASPLLGAADTAAATAGWAALESLLVSGQDAADRTVGRAVAADRAANLITASWPRSELSRLSRLVPNDAHHDLLNKRLDAADHEGKKRARVIREWLEQGRPLKPREARDQAAVARMQELIENPRAVLGRVRDYTTASLRRLYRQRNMILHGGEVGPLALRSTLRTAGPLVAATLDQLKHASDSKGHDPLAAVARAETALSLVGDPSGWDMEDLSR